MKRGFTIIEVSLVMGIAAILLGLSFFNISNLIPRANITATVINVVTEMRTQQHKAMTGIMENSSLTKDYAIYFTGNSYTIFQGITYAMDNPTNYVIELPAAMEFTDITFPDNTLVFTAPGGDVLNHTESTDTITIRHTSTGEEKTIELNRYGIPNTL